MSGLTDDWDSIPVKETKSSSNGLTDDWDSVPINTKQSNAQNMSISSGKAQGQRIAQEGSDWWNQFKSGNIKALPIVGATEAGLNAVTGIGSSAIGGLAGGARTLYNLAAGEGLDKATQLGAQTVENVQNAGTYQPRTAGGKLMTDVVNTPMNAVSEQARSIGGDIGQALGNREAGEAIGQVAPSVIGTLAGGKVMLNRPQEMVNQPTPPELMRPEMQVSEVPAYLRKGRPVQETQVQQPIKQNAPTLADTPPEFQVAAQGKAIDSAMQRHIEAQSLPVPINLTKGQATGDVHQISFEQNNRGANPALANTFADQNPKLIANIDAIKNQVAPNVTASGIALDQAVVDAYKKIDAPKVADISAKYKALEDANGGNFPLDGQTFVQKSEAALDKALKSGSVPADIQSAMNQFKNGRQMTFQDFETLRSDLADTMRNASDGRQRAAANIIREQLENMPLTPEAAQLKPLADAARQAAAARFKTIESDPAYKAAISDNTNIGEPSPIADKFIQKYVVNGKTANVQTMLNNLSSDPLAREHIAAGVMDDLKLKSGIDTRTNAGNLSQSGLNKAIRSLDQKKDLILDHKSAMQLDTLGNVARYTQEQPRGSYVNTSGTLTGALAEGAKSAAEGAANVTSFGIPVGTWVRKGIEKRAQTKKVNEALEPAAGTTKLKDFPQ